MLVHGESQCRQFFHCVLALGKGKQLSLLRYKNSVRNLKEPQRQNDTHSAGLNEPEQGFGCGSRLNGVIQASAMDASSTNASLNGVPPRSGISLGRHEGQTRDLAAWRWIAADRKDAL